MMSPPDLVLHLVKIREGGFFFYPRSRLSGGNQLTHFWPTSLLDLVLAFVPGICKHKFDSHFKPSLFIDSNSSGLSWPYDNYTLSSFQPRTVLYPLGSAPKARCTVAPYILSCSGHRTSFLAAVRVYWFICHSMSVPFSASVFPLISKRRIVILGPTSASSTDCQPVRTKT